MAASPQDGTALTPSEYAELPDLADGAVATVQPYFVPGQVLRQVIAPALPMRPPRPLLAGTEVFAKEGFETWHRRTEFPSRDLPCYLFSDAVVSGRGQIWLGGRLVVSPDVLPDYVYSMSLGLPDRAAELMKVHALPLRTVEQPTVVLPGGMTVYGHFLIETLFHILLARRALRGAGLRERWLLPRQAPPWLLRILHDDFDIPPEAIEIFRPFAERVHLRHAIVPALVHRMEGFHPAANALLEEWLDGLALPSPAPAARLFLARGDYMNPTHRAGRTCLNERALAEHAQREHGFRPVAMETLPWREQIALLRQAEIVAGQFGSALHGTLFCPPGTRVACIGDTNLVQSEIAALRGHDMAYLIGGIENVGDYTVDEAVFAAFLRAASAMPSMASCNTPTVSASS